QSSRQHARVMRGATAREVALHGRQVDFDKYDVEHQSEYQIIVRMGDMTPFAQHDEKFFQDSAALQTKKSKEKIVPTHVVYEKNAKGTVQDAIFFFPKSISSSAPLIAGVEKVEQFYCKIIY